MTDSQKISDLLKSRHDTYLEWVEPWPASGPDGKDVSADITIRASVNDCINLRRWHFKLPGAPKLDEHELLADFMSVYWAQVVTAPNAGSDLPPTSRPESQQDATGG